MFPVPLLLSVTSTFNHLYGRVSRDLNEDEYRYSKVDWLCFLFETDYRKKFHQQLNPLHVHKSEKAYENVPVERLTGNECQRNSIYSCQKSIRWISITNKVEKQTVLYI